MQHFPTHASHCSIPYQNNTKVLGISLENVQAEFKQMPGKTHSRYQRLCAFCVFLVLEFLCRLKLTSLCVLRCVSILSGKRSVRHRRISLPDIAHRKRRPPLQTSPRAHCPRQFVVKWCVFWYLLRCRCFCHRRHCVLRHHQKAFDKVAMAYFRRDDA